MGGMTFFFMWQVSPYRWDTCHSFCGKRVCVYTSRLICGINAGGEYGCDVQGTTNCEKLHDI